MAAGISFRIFWLPFVHPPPQIYPGIKIHQTLFLTGGSDVCMQKKRIFVIAGWTKPNMGLFRRDDGKEAAGMTASFNNKADVL
jgi:hypothetical protein